ncbi:MAG TPA: type B 50S ribosomal protein L31 [Moheibacter sp.]|nr:type B 50S ribosomal protein L31 [Moheibacter sp.]
MKENILFQKVFCLVEFLIFAHSKVKEEMKKGIHPENYRLVAFKDMSNDETFICRSAAETKETIEVDGVEYPLIKMEISSTSHPFYTGKMKLVDTAGRIDKFKSKYAKFKK